MTWFATMSDVTREANDGRGPVDFKVTRGAKDKTLVEFKLASNSQLKRNLEKQLEIYQKASDAPYGFVGPGPRMVSKVSYGNFGTPFQRCATGIKKPLPRKNGKDPERGWGGVRALVQSGFSS